MTHRVIRCTRENWQWQTSREFQETKYRITIEIKRLNLCDTMLTQAHLVESSLGHFRFAWCEEKNVRKLEKKRRIQRRSKIRSKGAIIKCTSKITSFKKPSIHTSECSAWKRNPVCHRLIAVSFTYSRLTCVINYRAIDPFAECFFFPVDVKTLL